MNEGDLFWFLLLTVVLSMVLYFMPLWASPVIAATAVLTFRCIYWLKEYFFP